MFDGFNMVVKNIKIINQGPTMEVLITYKLWQYFVAWFMEMKAQKYCGLNTVILREIINFEQTFNYTTSTNKYYYNYYHCKKLTLTPE